jgi:DNA primase
VLVEGNFDVVALHARGIGNVVAPLGTAFTPAQAKLLKRFAPTVTVLFDGDGAGLKATRASSQPCREGGLEAKVARLPKGADPDDFVREHGAATLERLIKGARGIREFLIEDALDGDAFRRGSLDEQRARLRAVQRILAEENDPTLRGMIKTYADLISAKLVVGGRPLGNLRELEATLAEAVRPPAGPQPHRPMQAAVPHDRARSRAQHDEIPVAILGSLLDFPALLRDPEVERALGVLDGELALAVAALRQHVDERSAMAHRHANLGPGPSVPDDGEEVGPGPEPSHHRVEIGVYAAEFLAQIPPSIQAFAVGRLASPAFDAIEDARTELLGNARKLSSLSLKRENAAEVELLHRVEAEGDADRENELLRALAERARKRHGLSPHNGRESQMFPRSDEVAPPPDEDDGHGGG